MLDPKYINDDDLGSLAGMYAHGRFLYGVELTDASAHGQKKIRKWLMKHYHDTIGAFPDDIRACFGQEYSDKAVLAFLRACDEQMRLQIGENQRRREENLAALNEEVRSAVLALLDEDYWPPVEQQGDTLVLRVDETPAFCRSLILKKAEGFCELPNGGYLADVPKIQRELERYRITAQMEDSEEPLSLFFAEAEVRVECFNCVESDWEEPWEYFQTLAGQIVAKSELPGDYCNAQEKALLPLLTELEGLDGWYEGSKTFPLMKKMAADYGCDQAVALLTQAEKAEPEKRHGIMNRLRDVLCRQECEPMWRDIFEKIRASQENYPHAAQMDCEAGILKELRESIQCFMEKQGYSGTYPDFQKRGAVPGFHLAESYGLSYFIFREKNAVFHIHCVESREVENKPGVHFLCGTEFLRKDDSVGDIYSCLFNTKGRRLFCWVRDYRMINDPDAQYSPEDVLRFAEIAVKKAELKKLTKEERKLYHNGIIPGWGLFWWWLLLGGGMFGIFMTLGMMLLAVIAALLVGQPEAIPSMFTDIPWGYVLLFCWLSFGAIMGILTVMAKRK